jgi:hypothetical protein
MKNQLKALLPNFSNATGKQAENKICTQMI